MSIRIADLTKSYGARAAVDGLSLSVAAGEIYALLGPNGAGKSTTLGCLLGFVRPDGGVAEVCGIDPVRDPAAARARIAYIPEQVSLYESFSGVENVAYFAALAGKKKNAAEIDALLGEAGLQAEAHGRRTAGYSKGMRQKVGIAIALAKEAEVLLLDEPTSGLDPSAAREFGLALARLRDRGVAVLMATHDLFRTVESADRVGILVGGRLIAERDARATDGAALEALYVEAVERQARAAA